MMNTSMKALFVDDVEDDVLLIARMLQKGGYDLFWERVETALGMRTALLTGSWDIVICDFKLPDFNGLAAIALLKELSPLIPIILVSGAIGEETAVECMKAGANDYVMKSNLTRLVPAVERELQEAHIRKERAVMEKKLRESEQRYRLLFEQSKDGVLLTKPDGTILDVNPAASEIFGRSVDDIRRIGRNGLVDMTDLRLQKALEERSRTGSAVAEFTMVRANGEKFPAEVSSSLFTDSDGEQKTSMIIRDITLRRQVEERLLQSQKMEAVGQLASGVAHDFNNMLGVILGYAEMAIEKVDPDSPLGADLRKILNATEKSSALTRQLLAFARAQAASPGVIHPNDAISGTFTMLRRLIGENISVDFQPGEGTWPVRIDPSLLDQILANLCVNARDAVAENGKVLIRTQNASLDETGISRHAGVPAGDYVMLSVSDNGCGIPSEIMGKIFDPFFTTKAAGKGTGLGLSTVFRIVHDSGGFIDVASEKNQGSVFRVYLPRCADERDDESEKKVDHPVKHGHETILIVEDEQALLFLSRQILEEKGYQVLTAALPSEAVRLVKGYKGTIDLLLTDVIMPEMNGRELAEKIRSLCGNTRLLFTSGYNAEVFVRDGVLEADAPFLSKPFTMIDLLAAVRDALDHEVAREEKKVSSPDDPS